MLWVKGLWKAELGLCFPSVCGEGVWWRKEGTEQANCHCRVVMFKGDIHGYLQSLCLNVSKLSVKLTNDLGRPNFIVIWGSRCECRLLGLHNCPTPTCSTAASPVSSPCTLGPTLVEDSCAHVNTVQPMYHSSCSALFSSEQFFGHHLCLEGRSKS